MATELIESIKELNVNFEENECMTTFYRGLSSLKDDIKANVSPELYDMFNVEYQCVYNEHLYGDGEYTVHVVHDCMDVLDLIIDAIIFKD